MKIISNTKFDNYVQDLNPIRTHEKEGIPIQPEPNYQILHWTNPNPTRLHSLLKVIHKHKS